MLPNFFFRRCAKYKVSLTFLGPQCSGGITKVKKMLKMVAGQASRSRLSLQGKKTLLKCVTKNARCMLKGLRQTGASHLLTDAQKATRLQHCLGLPILSVSRVCLLKTTRKFRDWISGLQKCVRAQAVYLEGMK